MSRTTLNVHISELSLSFGNGSGNRARPRQSVHINKQGSIIHVPGRGKDYSAQYSKLLFFKLYFVFV